MVEEPLPLPIVGNQNTNAASLHIPLPAPKKPSTTAVNNTKGKVRSAFSESQMNALVQRFSVQRYLTPAEMKNLAELTGLTYKQVTGRLTTMLHHTHNLGSTSWTLLLYYVCRWRLGFRTEEWSWGDIRKTPAGCVSATPSTRTPQFMEPCTTMFLHTCHL